MTPIREGDFSGEGGSAQGAREEADMIPSTMANHPNRSRTPAPGANPKPAEIKAAREAAGLTQSAAAELVYSTMRTWQDWESEGDSNRRMHPAIWELWQIKTTHLRGAKKP